MTKTLVGDPEWSVVDPKGHSHAFIDGKLSSAKQVDRYCWECKRCGHKMWPRLINKDLVPQGKVRNSKLTEPKKKPTTAPGFSVAPRTTHPTKLPALVIFGVSCEVNRDNIEVYTANGVRQEIGGPMNAVLKIEFSYAGTRRIHEHYLRDEEFGVALGEMPKGREAMVEFAEKILRKYGVVR